MFPNPQAALPLPPHPDLEQYRRLAKDLVKACEGDAISAWASRWIDTLIRLTGVSPDRVSLEQSAAEVHEFAKRKLGGARSCALADAQFVLARSHGFESWTKFAAHLDSLAHARGDAAGFEAAAEAIIEGDEETLVRLLREHPDLVRARSTREHHATLLHYTSANGVEGYRQKTPKNIVRITEILLDAGAEIDHQNLAGNAHSAVIACLANGQPQAAAYLADRGARLDLEGAAGLGRIEVVKSYFD